MKNKNTTVTLIWAAVVLVAATGLGYGIRRVRWTLATNKNLSESKPEVQVVESEPEVEPEPEPEPEVEVVEADETFVEEPVWEEPEDEPEPEVAAEPQSQPWQMGQNAGMIQKFFEDLNLNEEEQARLQEGFALMRRQFEKSVTQRMRERYEVWRQSDSVEIPRLTLD